MLCYVTRTKLFSRQRPQNSEVEIVSEASGNDFFCDTLHTLPTLF